MPVEMWPDGVFKALLLDKAEGPLANFFRRPRVLLQELLVLVNEFAVEAVVGLRQITESLARPAPQVAGLQRLDLGPDTLGRPRKPDHRCVNPVAVVCPLVAAAIHLQRPQRLQYVVRQVPQRLWNIARLRDVDPAPAKEALLDRRLPDAA